MWNAKVRYAMLAYENAQQAEAKKDLESVATNLVISYNLYKKAIEVRIITLEIFQDFIWYLWSQSKNFIVILIWKKLILSDIKNN